MTNAIAGGLSRDHLEAVAEETGCSLEFYDQENPNRQPVTALLQDAVLTENQDNPQPPGASEQILEGITNDPEESSDALEGLNLVESPNLHCDNPVTDTCNNSVTDDADNNCIDPANWCEIDTSNILETTQDYLSTSGLENA